MFPPFPKVDPGLRAEFACQSVSSRQHDDTCKVREDPSGRYCARMRRNLRLNLHKLALALHSILDRNRAILNPTQVFRNDPLTFLTTCAT
jgi:hypothetical protein